MTLLFDLIFDALLRAMAAMEKREMTEFEVALPARAYADDLTMQACSEEASVALMGAVKQHCVWSGKRLKVAKCEAAGYDLGSRKALNMSYIRYQELPLRKLLPEAAVQCLGVRFSMLLGWEEEYERVISGARELYHVCVKHTYLPVQMVHAVRTVLTLQFRYSVALAPWQGNKLNDLHQIWIKTELAALKMTNHTKFPVSVSKLPASCGGCPVPHPRVIQMQALGEHLKQLSNWNNSV